jgi:phage terminase large subunit
VQRSYIKGANGTLFLFEGLRSNVTKIKSMEGIDICWVEEAEKVTAESWDVLIPTIRKPGSEIWVTFNPDLEEDPTYQRFVIAPPPASAVVEMNYYDNPWFGETELANEEAYLRRVDPDRHANIWGGKPRKNNDAQILKGKWRIDSVTPEELKEADGPYFGADWGFSVDPTAVIKLWLLPGSVPQAFRLYIEAEAYQVGVSVVDLPTFFRRVPGSAETVIRADNARPELINHVDGDRGESGKEKPLRVIAAKKWPGSIEDGIDWLRSCEEIIIHPSCKHTQDEAKDWSYKKDRLTGDITTEIVDKHNHCWDAVRYALQPLIHDASRKKPPAAPSGMGSKSTWSV